MISGNDLFLLMFNLSHITDVEEIKRIFVESINSFGDEYQFSMISSDTLVSDEAIPIKTSSKLYGYIHTEKNSDRLSKEETALLRNAVRLLATILENRYQSLMLKERADMLEKKVEEHIALLSGLSRSVPILLYIYNLVEGKNIYTNQELYSLLGYSPEEAAAYGSGILRQIVHKDDFEKVLQHHLLLRNACPNKIFELEYRVIDIKGNEKWLLSRDTPFEKNSQGETISIVGSALDITKQKNLEEMLHHKKQEAEEANKAKTEFLANMSHELRTPMNTIYGMAQLIKNTDLDQYQQEYLYYLKKSSDHMIRLIDDLLLFSKIDAGKIELIPEPFLLKELVQETFLSLQSSAEKKKLRYTLTIDDNLPDFVIGDSLRLRQVLINIISNSVKFTKKGSIEISVSSDSKESGSRQIQFRIKDSGMGMSQKVQAHLFERFYQGDMSMDKQFQGTGLGLSIVYQLIEKMGGSITVNSEIGIGTEFYFTIPYEVSAKQAEKKLEKNKLSDVDLHKLIVLIAEDNEDNRILFKMVLQPLELDTILVAKNGKEAISVTKQKSPDVIFMDLQMPLLNGYDATREIRKLQADNKKKSLIVGVSANISEENRKESIQSGMDDFIPKPYNLADIEDVLRKHFSLSPKKPINFS